jgi:hypothetical protein
MPWISLWTMKDSFGPLRIGCKSSTVYALLFDFLIFVYTCVGFWKIGRISLAHSNEDYFVHSLLLSISI